MEPVRVQPARVRVDMAWTRNLGNYESLKISIGVEDSLRSGEGVDAGVERVYAFIENKLLNKVRETEQDLKSQEATRRAKKNG